MIGCNGTFVDPKGDNALSLYEVGWNLSRVPRFAGSTTRPWSVLQHTFFTSALSEWMVVKQKGTRKVMLDASLNALLHDAHEAILGDMPTPWKDQSRKDLEHELDVRLYRDNGVLWMLQDPTLVLILSQADHWAVQIEGVKVGPPGITERIGYDAEIITEEMHKMMDLVEQSTTGLDADQLAFQYSIHVDKIMRMRTGPNLDKLVG